MSLFDENVWLVSAIVNRMNYGYVEKDDIMQAGLMGLYKATLNYKPDAAFTTFATYYIVGEIKKEMRENQLIKLNKKMIKIIRYIKEHKEYPIISVCEQLCVTKDDVLTALLYTNPKSSLNVEHNNLEVIDSIANVHHVDILSDLPPIYRKVIYLRYYRNMSQNEVAKLLSFSQSKTSRIEKAALNQLKSTLY